MDSADWSKYISTPIHNMFSYVRYKATLSFADNELGKISFLIFGLI